MRYAPSTLAPEILIVGDASRRRGLIREVRDAGYEVTLCQPQELNRRVRTGPAPATILICLEDADAAVLLATLRRSRQGAAIPVVLFGQLGGEIRDLADVLDLGADHFVRDPYDPAQLRGALAELAGPGSRRADGPATPAASRTDGDAPSPSGWAMNTERLASERSDGERRRAPGNDETGPRDPVIGQLHKTLDRLEARLRDRDDEPAAPEVRPAQLVRDRLGRGSGRAGGHVDLDELGFDRIPDVEPEEGTLDPAELTHEHEIATGQASPDPDADTADDNGPSDYSSARIEAATDRGSGSIEEREFDPRREGSGSYSGVREPGTDGTVRLEQARRDGSGVLAPRRPPRRPTGEHDALDRGGTGGGRVATGIPRSGSLSERDVPSLLWELHHERATGRLRLARGRVEKQVWLVRGELRFARSGSSADRFVDDLLRRGVLTRAQYETARRLAAREPRRAGELLIEAGLIKSDELHLLLGDHLSHMVQSTFAWAEGTWSFEPGATVEEPITLDVNVERLLLDGVRHRVETSRLSAAIGSDLAAPRLIGGQGSDDIERWVTRLDLLDRERTWLERFDGEHPLRVFLDEPDVDEHGLLALVRALQVIGAIELDGDVVGRSRRDPREIDRDRVLERLRAAREADYFELLGLMRDATRTEVRRAYAEISETFADHGLEASTVEGLAVELGELRAALREARDILMDDALRSAYLAHLDDADDGTALG